MPSGVDLTKNKFSFSPQILHMHCPKPGWSSMWSVQSLVVNSLVPDVAPVFSGSAAHDLEYW